MYLAFDCETTGLLPKCNILTAYFVILDNKLNILDELHLMIRHNYYIVFTKALEVNKIDLIEHDKIALPLTNATQNLITFLNKYNTKYKIIGHNIQFDIDMIINNKLISPDNLKTYFDTDYYFDTYKIAKLLKSKNKINKCQSLSLSKLCYYFDINSNNDKFHDSKYDTLCTIELFKKLIELKQS